jgi:hypothetical protein
VNSAIAVIVFGRFIILSIILLQSACGTEPGEARETKRCGAWDAQGAGSRGVECGSVGQSVDRVQVMDLWSITLGDD